METTRDRFGWGEKPGAWIDSPGPFTAEEGAFEAAVARIRVRGIKRTAIFPDDTDGAEFVVDLAGLVGSAAATVYALKGTVGAGCPLDFVRPGVRVCEAAADERALGPCADRAVSGAAPAHLPP